MANIIEIANSAYEERDRAQEKLAILISQAEREKTEYEKEVTQMTNLIEKNNVRNNFIKSMENQKQELENAQNNPNYEEMEEGAKRARLSQNNWVGGKSG